MKLTDREVAAITWNTMYPDRRHFDKLEESTKVEWERVTNIVQQVLQVNELSPETIKEIKSFTKV